MNGPAKEQVLLPDTISPDDLAGIQESAARAQRLNRAGAAAAALFARLADGTVSPQEVITTYGQLTQSRVGGHEAARTTKGE